MFRSGSQFLVNKRFSYQVREEVKGLKTKHPFLAMYSIQVLNP